ncbi:MAG: DUF3501 family protein [Candidatus Thermoplasmatota archaeon]|jgi:hypothetical protein|nr:DUF3501 family protein [Candidatus Thermoplasmatota archaeon]
MEMIRRGDLYTPEQYSKILNEERRRIIEVKKERRIVSKTFSFLFENRDTILNQINEMIFVENVHDEREIDHLLETYNKLMPEKNEFSVTMFIEISDEKTLLKEMTRLVGIEDSVYLIYGDSEIKCIPEEGRSTETLESTLQYLKIRLSMAESEKFRASKNAFISTKHRNYSETAQIPESLLEKLKKEIY